MGVRVKALKLAFPLAEIIGLAPMSVNTLPPKAVLRNIFKTEKEKAGKCELLCL